MDAAELEAIQRQEEEEEEAAHAEIYDRQDMGEFELVCLPCFFFPFFFFFGYVLQRIQVIDLSAV